MKCETDHKSNYIWEFLPLKKQYSKINIKKEKKKKKKIIF